MANLRGIWVGLLLALHLAFPGCNGSDFIVELVYESGGFIPNTREALPGCHHYLSFNKGDASYWVDPDGKDTGIEAFIVTCDMSAGGYAVFQSQSSPAFPFTDLTDSSLVLFSDSEIAKINALRVQAVDIQVESDLVVNFVSDTAAGGCGGAPTIPSGDMQATTLPLQVGVDTVETVRELAGSADRAAIDFDKNSNTFVQSGATPSPGCADTLIADFGVGDEVWIKSLLLKTLHASRAYSKATGTYYRLLVK